MYCEVVVTELAANADKGLAGPHANPEMVSLHHFSAS
jgi:hypothetical protein